jgi:hypothetical protein
MGAGMAAAGWLLWMLVWVLAAREGGWRQHAELNTAAICDLLPPAAGGRCCLLLLERPQSKLVSPPWQGPLLLCALVLHCPAPLRRYRLICCGCCGAAAATMPHCQLHPQPLMPGWEGMSAPVPAISSPAMSAGLALPRRAAASSAASTAAGAAAGAAGVQPATLTSWTACWGRHL